MQTPNGSDDTSWWDDLINGLTQQQLPPPPAPQPPPVNQAAWEKSVEQAKVSDSLGTVHDLGLIVFNETQSYSDRADSNEPIGTAREKMAHSIINADQKYGVARQRLAGTASAIQPSPNALRNPTVRAAYDSSMKAAREAYLGGADPTTGAVFSIQQTTPDRSNYVFHNGRTQGVPISTQSGPYNNSFPNKKVPSRTAWLNTYWDK
jgi:hypothetical protein